MGMEMLNIGRMDEFMEFQKGMFPGRADPEKRFRWQFLENPFLRDRNHPLALLFRKQGRIVGQSLINPFPWTWNSEHRTGYMNTDWHVQSAHRGASGMGLALKTFSIRPYFGIGFSPDAEKIWKRLGARVIGSMRFFMWLDLAGFTRLLCRKREIPTIVSSQGKVFRQKASVGGWEDTEWEGTLQFSRPPELLEWRFLRSYRRYHLYMSGGENAYFVVRKTRLRGMPFLVLVDYRVRQGDSWGFRAAVKACKRVCRLTGSCGIITASSNRFFDRLLKRERFMRTRGRDLIMTNSGAGSAKKAARRELVYATMADSDVDLVRF